MFRNKLRYMQLFSLILLTGCSVPGQTEIANALLPDFFKPIIWNAPEEYIYSTFGPANVKHRKQKMHVPAPGGKKSNQKNVNIFRIKNYAWRLFPADISYHNAGEYKSIGIDSVKRWGGQCLRVKTEEDFRKCQKKSIQLLKNEYIEYVKKLNSQFKIVGRQCNYNDGAIKTYWSINNLEILFSMIVSEALYLKLHIRESKFGAESCAGGS